MMRKQFFTAARSAKKIDEYRDADRVDFVANSPAAHVTA
jgi:hypothetical protein